MIPNNRLIGDYPTMPFKVTNEALCFGLKRRSLSWNDMAYIAGHTNPGDMRYYLDEFIEVSILFENLPGGLVPMLNNNKERVIKDHPIIRGFVRAHFGNSSTVQSCEKVGDLLAALGSPAVVKELAIETGFLKKRPLTIEQFKAEYHEYLKTYPSHIPMTNEQWKVLEKMKAENPPQPIAKEGRKGLSALETEPAMPATTPWTDTVAGNQMPPWTQEPLRTNALRNIVDQAIIDATVDTRTEQATGTAT